MIGYIFSWVKGSSGSAVVMQELGDVEDVDGKCKELAEELFTSQVAHIEEALKGSFTLFVTPDEFSDRIRGWSEEIHLKALDVFGKFTEEELEGLTAGSGKELLDKSNALALKVSGMLANQGALILLGNLSDKEKIPTIKEKPKSIVGRVVDQHLESYAKGIIRGTVWRYGILTRRNPEDELIKNAISKLGEEYLYKNLFCDLQKEFAGNLTAEYQKAFDEEQLNKLYALQNLKVYKSIEDAIGNPLQKKVITWITLKF